MIDVIIVQFCRYLNLSEVQKWSTSFVSWVTWPKCSILIGLSCAVVYIYVMQTMCFCWLCCFVRFLTNTYQLFITNGAHVFKKTLTLGYIVKNLLCLFAKLLRENPLSLKNQWGYYQFLQPSCTRAHLIIYVNFTKKRSTVKFSLQNLNVYSNIV